MKVIALTIAVLVISTTARAQEIDFGAIKCATYLQKFEARNQEARNEQPGANSELKVMLQTVNVWLYGYASAKTGATGMSAPEGVNFVRELAEQCVATPEKDIAQAAVDAMRVLGEKA